MADKIGLNLGTLQEQLAAQPMQIIESIYQLGIRNLELPDIALAYRLHPVLKGAGFNIPSSFFPSPYITENWAPMASLGMKLPSERKFAFVVKQAQKYGLSHIVMPGLFPQERGGLDVYLALADKLNLAGETSREAGVQLCYHHYSYELQPMGDTSPLEVMLNRLDNELVKLEVDTFWLALSGTDLMEFLQKYQSKTALLHLADIGSSVPQTYRAVTLPPESYQPVGDGVINFESLLNSKLLDEVPYYFIHLEASAATLDAVSKSYKYLKQFNF